jgi:Flp pilus assembly protein TadD
MIEQLDKEFYPSTEEAALTTYEQAIELAPRQAVLHYHKGQILEHMGRTREARTAFEIARTLGYQC